MRRILSLLIAVLLAALALSAAAQDAAPEATPEPPDCTAAGLKAYYAALVEEAQAALDSAPLDADVPQETFGVLYDAGASLQARMLACGYIPADIDALPVGEGTSLERVLEVLDTLTPDLLRGQLLYLGEERSALNAALGCAGCHQVAQIAPPTEGTWTRWDEQYRLLPEYDEQPFAYYAAESILYPHAHVEAPYLPTMPENYATTLSFQDLADLIAFLESQDQLIETGG